MTCRYLQKRLKGNAIIPNSFDSFAHDNNAMIYNTVHTQFASLTRVSSITHAQELHALTGTSAIVHTRVTEAGVDSTFNIVTINK
jgi:hypothetical protein